MVFSTIVDGVDVKIFVPDRVDVFRGALLHSANASFKTSGRWAELCKSQGWVHVVTTMKNVRKQGNRGPRLHKAAVEGLKQCGEAASENATRRSSTSTSPTSVELRNS